MTGCLDECISYRQLSEPTVQRMSMRLTIFGDLNLRVFLHMNVTILPNMMQDFFYISYFSMFCICFTLQFLQIETPLPMGMQRK